jgi:hypothetical protein
MLRVACIPFLHVVCSFVGSQSAAAQQSSVLGSRSGTSKRNGLMRNPRSIEESWPLRMPVAGGRCGTRMATRNADGARQLSDRARLRGRDRQERRILVQMVLRPGMLAGRADQAGAGVRPEGHPRLCRATRRTGVVHHRDGIGGMSRGIVRRHLCLEANRSQYARTFLKPPVIINGRVASMRPTDCC